MDSDPTLLLVQGSIRGLMLISPNIANELKSAGGTVKLSGRGRRACLTHTQPVLTDQCGVHGGGPNPSVTPCLDECQVTIVVN